MKRSLLNSRAVLRSISEKQLKFSASVESFSTITFKDSQSFRTADAIRHFSPAPLASLGTHQNPLGLSDGNTNKRGLVTRAFASQMTLTRPNMKTSLIPDLNNLHKRGMFIQTQSTPNPNSLMFVPGRNVMEEGSANFPNPRAGMASPLAQKLFTIDGVKGVFFGSDFVTITKSDDYEWATLKPETFAAIMDFFASGQPLMKDGNTEMDAADASHAACDDDSEVVAMIKELLDTRIRPAVQDDGGDIKFRMFDEDVGIVVLEMQGACSACPSSTVTLKSGIENMLMHYIPEVKGVVQAENDEDEPGVDTTRSMKFKTIEDHLSN